MPELSAWAAYFQSKHGLLPAGMLYLERRQIEGFLAPCQWPEWFDTEYQPPQRVPTWPKPEAVLAPTEASRARVGLWMRDLKKAIGLGRGKFDPASMPAAEEPPPVVSDDELRRLYPSKASSAA